MESENDKSVVLSVNWGGGSVSVHKVTRAVAAQVVMLAEAGQAVHASQGQKFAVAASGSGHMVGGPKMAPREALSKSAARTFPQKIAALGLYLMNTAGRESFTPAEIQALLKRSGETSANFSRDFSTAERQLGYILENSSGEYELTDLGKEAAATGFEAASLTSGRKRRRVAKKAKKGVRENGAE